MTDSAAGRKRTIRQWDSEEVLLHGLLSVYDKKDPSFAIEIQEKHGQREFVNSDTLPIEGTKPQRKFNYVKDGESGFETMDEWFSHPDDPQFAELGFVLGDRVPGDDLFRYGTLPEGWRKVGTSHDMHSTIVDERGRERASVFYKAAFYDRRAEISIGRFEGPNGLVYADHAFQQAEPREWDGDRGPSPRCEYGRDMSDPFSTGNCGREADHRWHHTEAEVPYGDKVGDAAP